MPENFEQEDKKSLDMPILILSILILVLLLLTGFVSYLSLSKTSALEKKLMTFSQNTEQKLAFLEQEPKTETEIEMPEEIKMLNYSATVPFTVNLSYPEGYEVLPATENFKVLTLNKKNGSLAKLEIFRNADFTERPISFDEGTTPAEIEMTLPKQIIKVGFDTGYEARLFYSAGDTNALEDLRKIVDSVNIR
jgi:flagellar basal body-associated protein FliL